jgi:4-hydroxybenzoate polyprenyltransferase
MTGSPLHLISAWSALFRYPTPGDSRLKAIIYYSIFVSIGLFFASRGVPPLITSLEALGVMISITIFVYILNDAIDADFDKLSSVKSERPIASGKVTKRQALLLSAIGGVIGVALSFTLNLWTTVLALLYMSLGFSYSVPPLRFKTRFLMKETTLTSGMILSVLIGCSAIGSISPNILLPALFFAFGGMTLYPVLYDTEDIQEDKLGGCKTIAMILNQKGRLELATFGILMVMIVTTLTYGYFELNIISPIITVFVSLLFLRYVFSLLMKPEATFTNEVINKVISVGRAIVFIIPIGYILGAVQL